ncbi:hypothetical protein E4P42_06915 [Mycobacterium sp. PS03-16]|uniref:VOC family protein n=1 Tax=Mycobacterium sp. PS03-16 TaxID=2559611 RepID=UPI001073416E|nr:VOC family protein [Mycobacterium sp. PS03-16]TFV59626.1 hypothetical protein E4P42_06915 [Mycobacterium sp. PS03-16]
MTTATLGPLLVDAADPAGVAAFWSAALGADAQRRLMRFRAERGSKVVKNRVHVDVAVRDVGALLALGARELGDHRPGWVTLADVEGNEFCAFPDGPVPAGAPARLFAVCTDSDRPEELAAWWAARVGARIGPGPDQRPRWLYGSAGWEDVIWKFVRVGDPRCVPNRWQPTLFAPVDALLAAGAVRSLDGDLTDPQGNEFSVADPARPAG